MRILFGMLAAVALVTPDVAVAVAAAPAAIQIPSIGCPSGGQDTRPAPPDTIKPVRLDPRLAARLSYYGGDVLGPRGWHCQQYTTDEGYVTYVTQQVIVTPDAVAGPAIMVFNLDSTASGRFDVAQTIARYFPRRWDFARKVMAEDDAPGPFVFHPYRADRFVARRGTMLEIVTPPHARGFGTFNFLPDGLAIHSRAYFFDNREEPGFLITRVRLPRKMNDLLPAVLGAVHP